MYCRVILEKGITIGRYVDFSVCEKRETVDVSKGKYTEDRVSSKPFVRGMSPKIYVNNIMTNNVKLYSMYTNFLVNIIRKTYIINNT